jgi:hypothetical protein
MGRNHACVYSEMPDVELVGVVDIERKPGYGLNYANLAALYWQQSDKTAALAAAEQAERAAPLEVTFWFNLGFYR